MLIVSPEFNCSNEILTIVAMLSGKLEAACVFRTGMLTDTLVPNVWIRPPNQRKEADAAKQLLTVPDGDHLTFLNVYNNYHESMLTSAFSTLTDTYHY